MADDCVTIKSGQFSASLSSMCPQVIRLNGLDGSGAVEVRLRDLRDGSYITSGTEIRYEATARPESVTYLGHVSCDARPAGEFLLRYLAQDDRLVITCEFRKEHEGFELMSVTVPLASAEAGRDGSLVIPVQGGRLVDIGRSEPREYRQRASVHDLPQVAMLRQGGGAALLELSSYDDNLVSAVRDESGRKLASLGVVFAHRYGPQSPDVPTFKVTNRSEAFVSVFPAEGKHWWTEGAKMLRRKVNASIPPLYDGAFVYKIKLDQPDFQPGQILTFDDALDRVRRVCNLTAGAPQVAYLNGWQYEGHDTGYPDVFEVNKDCGSLDDFRRVLRSGSRYNATISFHDNYDDAYECSPAWDEGIIGVNEKGVPKTGGVWGAGQAYIISPHKYIEGARERIRRTVEMYGVADSIHVDCFSSCTERYDFDPENPAGFARSIEAKNYIIRAFRELGLDMTSESMCPAFAGNVGYGWHFDDSDEAVYSAEEVIPLVPFIYHGLATGAGGVDDDRHLLKHLLWGLPFCADIRWSTDLAQFIEKYYLITVPYFVLANRTMTSYEADGSRHTVHYGDDTRVTVDYDDNSYHIVADGATIARDFVTMCPMPQGGWGVYSRHGGRVSLSLPCEQFAVFRLTEEGRSSVADIEHPDGLLALDAEPGVPYHISEPRQSVP